MNMRQPISTTTFVLVLDCSPSMDAAFRETTRRLAARDAAWEAIRILQACPQRERIHFAQVVFEGEARTWLAPTPVAQVTRAHIGFESFCFWGQTNICAGLVESEASLWPSQPRHHQGLLAGESIAQALCRFFEEPRIRERPSLPPLLSNTHLLIVSDGEQNHYRDTAEDCVRQAVRLKEAGVRIYARGIGEPHQFGLLRRLVSNPWTDFGVDQAPDSLRQAFRRIAQGLIR